MTGHYLTHPALTNIPVNHRMLGNSNCFFSVSFYPNMPRRCPFLRPPLRFPVCMLVLEPPKTGTQWNSIRAMNIGLVEGSKKAKGDLHSTTLVPVPGLGKVLK